MAINLDRLPKRDDRFETTIGDKLLKVRVTKADDRKAIEINLVCETIADEEETEERDK